MLDPMQGGTRSQWRQCSTGMVVCELDLGRMKISHEAAFWTGCSSQMVHRDNPLAFAAACAKTHVEKTMLYSIMLRETRKIIKRTLQLRLILH